MNSIASGQFPMQVWRKGVRHLWTPIHRRPLGNRPEERVRQQVIEYLLRNGWPKSRISTEETISPATARENGRLRTDLICYSRSFEPVILVECKAETIRIDEQTSLQAARYNRQVGAPWLLMTNGETDHWFHVGPDARLPRAVDGPPEGYGLRAGETLSSHTGTGDVNRPLKAAEPGSSYEEESAPSRAAEYWTRRGFLGSNTSELLQSRLIPLLEREWRGNAGKIRYLTFNSNPLGADIDHYYAIRQGKEHLVACSLQSVVDGGTRMIAVFNRDNKNRGLTCISLATDPEQMKAEIYSAEGRFEAELPESLNILEKSGGEFINKWVLEVEQLFMQHGRK